MPENQARTRAPSRLRFAFFVFLGVYPLVTILQLIVLPLTEGWPMLLRNLVFLAIVLGHGFRRLLPPY
jgi:antibiotic biosynthesis monooxygenase (ABM) superfamily enzyme